jgi:GntR family transcriptional regulator/MocR family aminotransferase
MPKQPGFLTVPISLNRQARRPLWRQLYDALRKAVLDGQLARGTRLPPTREMAAELEVARNTVNSAYDQLIAEGFLEGRQGAGTFVSRRLPEEVLQVRVERKKSTANFPRELNLSDFGQTLLNTKLAASADLGPPKPFRPGTPAIDVFPNKVWGKLVSQRWRTLSLPPIGYGESAGFPPLRASIAEYVRMARGVRCSPDQVIVTAGAQQAINLAARLLLRPGDGVWFEDPGYVSARAILSSTGAQIVPISVDDRGLVVAAGRKKAPTARMAYVTPSHQYPLGAVMSLSRRLALLEWARKAEAWILEDDYDSEYRYSGHPIASLQGLDEGERVIYVGTFSKVLFPALRLGYLIVPDDLVDVFLKARLTIDHSSPVFDQVVLTDFIEQGHFARHIRRMRAVYTRRRQALVEAAGELLDGRMSIVARPAGLHAVAWLNEGDDAHELSSRFEAAGVETPPLSNYAIQPLDKDGFILGYGAVMPEDTWAAMRIISRVLSQQDAI